MRYSTVPAINLEQHVSRNRELISALPVGYQMTWTWSPAHLGYINQAGEVRRYY